MMTNIDYNIFKAIEQDKKLTEIYLGYKPFDWFFTKAKYSATCTEAVEFTLFDKTICGLLNIESSLSFEEIGEILGFNVTDNPSQRKYKDFAEYEILKDALQSLEEFEMITTGDSSYSYCQLTDIGKEYFQKGKKFKVHTNKRFELYFDNTNNHHSIAKDNFEFLNSVNTEENSINSRINYEDEQLLKSFSENQIPEIYNVAKMNSFKDSVLIEKEHKSATLYAVFLVDVISGKYRTLVYEEYSKTTNDYFSSYLNENKVNADNLFFQILRKYGIYQNPTSSDFSYRKELLKSQKEIERLITEDKNISEKIAKNVNQLEFIEPFMFIDKLDTIIKNSENEVWLMFNKVSGLLIETLSKIIIDIKDKYLFIYLPVSVDLETELEEFKSKVSETLNSYLIIGNIDEFNVITENSNKTFIYKKEIFPLEISSKSIKYQFVKKHTNVEIKEHIDSFRRDFADEYVKNINNKIDSLIAEKINNDDLSNYSIKEIEDIDFKIRPFYNSTEHDLILSEIRENKIALLKAVKNAKNEKIKSFINSMLAELKILELSDERKFKTLKSKINKEKEKFEEQESSLFLELEKKFLLKEKEFELIKKRKSIIIDTNILIEEPKIIDVIGPLQNIVFSKKVIDELDNKKRDYKIKDKAQQAIKEILKHQKDKNIYFEESNISNLSNDYDENSPDNKILSVSLKYKRKNPIILTKDKGLMLKAEIEGIPAKNIDELSRLLSLSIKSFSKRKLNNRKKR
ncbi:PIN domain-containing protein [Cellulophaga fucicola]|uniref:PIN domain-containing protein n=1 Tax=Cellulophaga fucicola TaxID=76595 RepID=A0A1K1QXB8_9FLAO|nr:PIN domain-containing protein [Cellulophaga fucicola]SFW64321.1 PIN domain-containing protein [Cellulophaga fucicola]